MNIAVGYTIMILYVTSGHTGRVYFEYTDQVIISVNTKIALAVAGDRETKVNKKGRTES